MLRIARHPAFLLAAPAAILAAAGLTGLLLDGPAFAHVHAWPAPLATGAGALTDLGKSGWILVSSGAVALAGMAGLTRRWLPSTRQRISHIAGSAGLVFVSVATSGILANLLKRIIGRPRPGEALIDGLYRIMPLTGPRHESFPSGHATTFGAVFACLAFFVPAWRMPLLVLGLILASTRVFVSAHFPSDVVAGYGLGLWIALLIALFFDNRGIPYGPPRR